MSDLRHNRSYRTNRVHFFLFWKEKMPCRECSTTSTTKQRRANGFLNLVCSPETAYPDRPDPGATSWFLVSAGQRVRGASPGSFEELFARINQLFGLVFVDCRI